MNVFVSWSGKLSQSIANIMRKYLPCMIQDLKVFMSKHDIESGVRWGTTLAKELEESSFGILCLTQTNLNSPWLLYEAGALTKHIEGRACGLLVGSLSPADVTGPLNQFQHRNFDSDGMKILIEDLNKRLKSPLDTEQIRLVFDKWWPDINSEYEKALSTIQDNEAELPKRDDRDILEEILRLSRLTVQGSSLKQTRADYAWADDLIKKIIKNLDSGSFDLLLQLKQYKVAGNDEAAQKLARERPEDVSRLTDIGIAWWKEGKLLIHNYFRNIELNEIDA